MLKFILIAAMVMLASCAEDSPQSPVIPNEKNEFSLELSTRTPIIGIGEIPQFVLKMKNNTDSNLVLPLFLDGSAGMERYPHTYFLVNGKLPEKMSETKFDKDHPVPLSPTNFITLRPGETYMPDMDILNTSLLNTFDHEGLYKMTFVYCLESDEIGEWGFSDANEQERSTMMQVFHKVPKETFTSNTIEIKVLKS